ncbi:MAG: B12-binding domain-containing radical SAM protein [Saprospiraceae bacterium]|nr:B12-binding domain-containing radical SAM protein [Saprospiraceae bacterium]
MSRKKILLYNPKAVFFDMPLALLSIGSMLDPNHYEVIIIDARVCKDPLKIIEQHNHDAILFGVTALTGNPLRDALDTTRFVKKNYPHLITIWGGWHPSLFPKQTLKDEPSIDITVQGQGELTFRELVFNIESKADLAHVAGITYRNQQNEIIQNEKRPLADINQFTRINYDLINVEEYFRLKGRRQLDYISSTGCFFRCSFCADPFVYKRKWTGIDPVTMVQDLEYWYHRLKFTDINFQDETFFTYRNRIKELAVGLINKGIDSTWAGTMRADQGARMSEEDFDLCKKSGLRRVLIGVESGSQNMLNWLQKDIKLEDVLLCARRCVERDIAVIFPFIVGFPNETDQSVQASLEMAKVLNSMHPDFTTPIFYFKPYPGSKITEEVLQAGYQLPENLEAWTKFDYIGSSGPWVNNKKYQLIELFKFYNKLGWSRKRTLLFPLQKMARWRINRSNYRWPVEKFLAEVFIPSKKLS